MQLDAEDTVPTLTLAECCERYAAGTLDRDGEDLIPLEALWLPSRVVAAAAEEAYGSALPAMLVFADLRVALDDNDGDWKRALRRRWIRFDEADRLLTALDVRIATLGVPMFSPTDPNRAAA